MLVNSPRNSSHEVLCAHTFSDVECIEYIRPNSSGGPIQPEQNERCGGKKQTGRFETRGTDYDRDLRRRSLLRFEQKHRHFYRTRESDRSAFQSAIRQANGLPTSW